MKIAMISLGCPKNQCDADVLCRTLIEAGHTTTAELGSADMIIVNTCGFIESAKQEAIETILDACGYKAANPALKVVVTGCLAQRYGDEILKEIPECDAVVGIGANTAILEILGRAQKGEKVSALPDKELLPLTGKRVISTPSHYAYLKIAEGCSNRCHYCAIPLIRGPLRSRPMEDALQEAAWLAEQGVKELIVVAQDITAYGEDLAGRRRLPELLRELEKVEGIVWIRLLYAYPERIGEELVQVMAESKKIVPYLDIPIQHINTELLQSMNRKGTRETVVTALERVRRAVPEVCIRSTLITGYPGETQAQYEELCRFVKEYKIDRLGCFAYSQEEGTVAATWENQLPEELRQERADHIMELQADIMAQKQQALVGTRQLVLCDEFDEESGLYLCRTRFDAPEIDGLCCVSSEKPLIPGHFYTVQITDSDVYDLYADLIGGADL